MKKTNHGFRRSSPKTDLVAFTHFRDEDSLGWDVLSPEAATEWRLRRGGFIEAQRFPTIESAYRFWRREEERLRRNLGGFLVAALEGQTLTKFEMDSLLSDEENIERLTKLPTSEKL